MIGNDNITANEYIHQRYHHSNPTSCQDGGHIMYFENTFQDFMAVKFKLKWCIRKYVDVLAIKFYMLNMHISYDYPIYKEVEVVGLDSYFHS